MCRIRSSDPTRSSSLNALRSSGTNSRTRLRLMKSWLSSGRSIACMSMLFSPPYSDPSKLRNQVSSSEESGAN